MRIRCAGRPKEGFPACDSVPGIARAFAGMAQAVDHREGKHAGWSDLWGDVNREPSRILPGMGRKEATGHFSILPGSRNKGARAYRHSSAWGAVC